MKMKNNPSPLGNLLNTRRSKMAQSNIAPPQPLTTYLRICSAEIDEIFVV